MKIIKRGLKERWMFGYGMLEKAPFERKYSLFSVQILNVENVTPCNKDHVQRTRLGIQIYNLYQFHQL